jgi:dsDNA-specific endonuclease/ATPase MutS2
MPVFQINDSVETIDDTIKGIVVAINNTIITIKTEDGFDMTYDSTELVKISDEIIVSNYDVAKVKSQKEIPRKKRATSIKPKERNAPKMEVDLHIHQLTSSESGMTSHDKLNLQIETAKRQLEFAIRKRIQKVVFIHGVGEGILKEELKYLFGRYDTIKYYDADYQKYGLGATEVYIFQNT